MKKAYVRSDTWLVAHKAIFGNETIILNANMRLFNTAGFARVNSIAQAVHNPTWTEVDTILWRMMNKKRS
jgi:hypothetical protein